MYTDRKKTWGFTLIELLIVMVILGLLASLVAPTMFGKVASSKQGTAKAQMQMLATAVDAFRLDTGDFPNKLSELRESTNEYWDGPYMPKEVPKDPWGNEYMLMVADNGFEFTLMSYGKDGELGGEGENQDVEY